MTSRRTCGTNTRTRECDFKDQNMGYLKITLWLNPEEAVKLKNEFVFL